MDTIDRVEFERLVDLTRSLQAQVSDLRSRLSASSSGRFVPAASGGRSVTLASGSDKPYHSFQFRRSPSTGLNTGTMMGGNIYIGADYNASIAARTYNAGDLTEAAPCVYIEVDPTGVGSPVEPSPAASFPTSAATSGYVIVRLFEVVFVESYIKYIYQYQTSDIHFNTGELITVVESITFDGTTCTVTTKQIYATPYGSTTPTTLFTAEPCTS